MSAQRRKKRTREQIIVLVVDGLSGLAESPVLMPTISAIFDFKVIDSRYIEMVGDVGQVTKEANS